MKAMKKWLLGIAERRSPDVVIGGWDSPYLMRWWIIPKNRMVNVFLHRFMRSDDDRAMHDHPWVNASILLDGEYIEHTPGREPVLRRPGAIYLRRAVQAHRVELIEERPVWTLFVTGPKIREWGFLCPRGWRHWRQFTSGPNGETIGRGCE